MTRHCSGVTWAIGDIRPSDVDDWIALLVRDGEAVRLGQSVDRVVAQTGPQRVRNADVEPSLLLLQHGEQLEQVVVSHAAILGDQVAQM